MKDRWTIRLQDTENLWFGFVPADGSPGETVVGTIERDGDGWTVAYPTFDANTGEPMDALTTFRVHDRMYDGSRFVDDPVAAFRHAVRSYMDRVGGAMDADALADAVDDVRRYVGAGTVYNMIGVSNARGTLAVLDADGRRIASIYRVDVPAGWIVFTYDRGSVDADTCSRAFFADRRSVDMGPRASLADAVDYVEGDTGAEIRYTATAADYVRSIG